MKIRIPLFCTFLILTAGLSAQVEFGLKGGLTTESLQDKSYSFDREGRQSLLLDLEGADYGVQFGALLRFPLKGSWGLQTEATLNSAKTTFRVDGSDGGTDNGLTSVFEERYNDLNVPVLLTYQLFKILRLHAGPVGHFYVSSSSDLTDEEGIDRTFETLNLGYNAGVSLDIGQLTLDVRYGGNFANYGETFTLRGAEVDVDQAPRRWIGTVAYRF
jgi:hypothetical protein